MNQSQPKMNLNLSLKDGQPVKCECGNQNWLPVVRFFKFSSLLTGSQKDSIYPLETFLCSVCGKLCQDMLPLELRDKPKIDVSNIEIE